MSTLTSTTSSLTDRELLGQVREGVEDALFVVHQRHVPPVYRCSRRILNDPGAAEECTQDVFLLLWNKRKSVEIFGESLLPWLLTTAKYLSLNRARKLQRERLKEAPLTELQVANVIDPLHLLEELENVQEIREAVRSLTEVDRAIVSLCIGSGLSYKEAAVRLDLTHASVRNRLSRARDQLRRTLSDLEGGNAS